MGQRLRSHIRTLRKAATPPLPHMPLSALFLFGTDVFCKITSGPLSLQDEKAALDQRPAFCEDLGLCNRNP